MAETWQGASTSWLPPNFDTRTTEGPEPVVASEVRRQDDRFVWTSTIPGQGALTLPVEVIMGGQRHGLGFLSRIEQLKGVPLQRPALIQGRYAWSPAHDSLVLAPGCPSAKPRSLETAFGLVLSPAFETRCLACHGKPGTLGAGKFGGVHCESCHGPGSEHPAHGAIINPRKLNTDESIAICAQCHVGLTNFSDPSPDDLLVANQVRAMEASECFIQSGKAFTCSTCHDPHGEAANDDAKSVATCLGCHSSEARQPAGICPVNPSAKCLGCHMPAVENGPLHLVDHYIRVHPEQGVTAQTGHKMARSQVRPLREFLRIIVTKNGADCEKASARLAAGEPFYDVARAMSIDPSAAIGGYLGAKWLAQLDPAEETAAAKLDYGETSGVFVSGELWMILQRLPRDFRWQAEQLQQEANSLLLKGDASAAIAKSQQALRIYPHFLRALMFIGAAFAESGNVQRASEVVRLATKLYPNDGGASAALAMTLDALGRREEAIREYRRAIRLEPDLLSAYGKLGTLFLSGGELQDAIEVLRQGLNVNPLAAELYYSLSTALTRAGDSTGAERALTLATAIDPQH